MKEFIQITWTAGSLDEARKISRKLVEMKLVASAQVIPWVESIYIWDNQLETVQESKISLKTVRDYFEQVKEFIEKNCTYEIPEIIFQSIDGGNEAYLNWINDSVQVKQVRD